VAPRDAYGLPGKRLALRASVGISGEDPETRTCWIDIAGPGTWNGHPNGPFELTVEKFKSCIAALEAQQNPIVVDYDHASLSVNPDGGAPAAGWVQSLELRGDRLWACVEWCADAALAIRAGKFRFCSGVFVFDEPDRQTGSATVCAIDSVALTNRPFIDGQQPIALTRTVQLEIPNMPPDAPQTDDAGKMLAARLMEATGLDAAALLAALDANLEAVSAALKGEKAPAAPASEPPPAPAATAPAAAPPAPAADTAALSTQVAALTAQVAALKAENAPLLEAKRLADDAALVSEVDLAVKAGKFHPSTRDRMVDLARKDPSGIRALMSATPAHLPHAPSTAPAVVPPSQTQTIDKDSKRRELTARVAKWPGLSEQERKTTVERQMAELYPEGN